MKAFLRVAGWIVLLSALALGGWWAWPLVVPPAQDGWLSRLAKADSALQQGRLDRAKLALEPWPEGLSAGQWLQWHKRTRLIARETGQWDWALLGALAALKQFPGNSDLTAVATWMMLKAGRAAEAATMAEKALAKSSWEPLLRQAWVESKFSVSAVGPHSWSDLARDLGEPRAELLPVYDVLLEISPSAQLSKNALLVALSVGRMDLAQRYLGSLSPAERDARPFDRLQALMAYDQQDWARSAALLRHLSWSDTASQEILADVYLHLGQPAQARLIYDQILADHPSGADDSATGVPATVFLNRASLALMNQDPGTALALVNRALGGANSATIPEVALSQLRLMLLEARFQLGETEAVRTQIGKVLESGRSEGFRLQAELLKDRLFPEMQSVPRLWSLLHAHPEAAEVLERLVWVLIVQKDYAAAHKALDLFALKNRDLGPEPPWWFSSFEAILLSLESRWDEALKALDRVPASWRDAPYWSNRAQVATILARQPGKIDRQALLETAAENDSRAIDLLPNGEAHEDLVLRARLLAHRGLVYGALAAQQTPAMSQRLIKQSLEDLRKAVQLDPENLRAAFLLRQASAPPEEKK